MSNQLPDEMTCIEISEPGGPEVLRPRRRPRPHPGQGEILVKVAAAAINRPDVLQRQGHYPPPPGVTDIPGLDVAGTVAALGDDVTGWHLGDAVTALVAGGGYAEYCVVPAPQCLPRPRGLSWVEAAALPETFFTVWSNLFDRCRLEGGETALIHGGSSGIGTAAIAMAKALGSRVIVTAGTEAKCTACSGLGADLAINYRERDFVAEVKAFTGGKGVDVILDMVAGDYLGRNVDCLAEDGRLGIIAVLGGSRGEIDAAKVLRKRLTVTGSTLRARPVAFKGEIARNLEEKVWPLIEEGRIRPVIQATFPLEDAEKAHGVLDEGDHVGKVVLTVD